MSTDGAIRVKGLAFPISPNPPSGKFYLGVDSSDGHFKKQDSTGTVVDYDASSSYTDEQAQDAVGNILADTATIDFTYADGVPQITADVKDGSITDAKLASGIDGAKLQNLSVANSKIIDLDGAKLIPVSVTDAKLATGIDSAKIGLGTVSNTEFSYLDGVTSAIQTQINGKANTVHTHVSTDVTDFTEAAQDAVGTILVDTSTVDFTYNDASNQITADVKDGSITDAKVATGIDATKISGGLVTNTEFGYLDGVTSAIQTQIDGKANTIHTHVASDVTDFNEAAQDSVGGILTDTATIDFTYSDGSNTITADLKDNSVTNAKLVNGAVDDSKVSSGINALKIGSGVVDNTELSYLDGVTSAIQTQIDSKESITNVNSGLALKANKSGDTFTGAVVIKGDNVSTGYVNYETQTTVPATPSSGFRQFADSLGRFAWKGVNGFVRTFNATGITADRIYSLPDASVALMGDVLTSIGDIFYRNGSNVTSRLPIGNTDDILRVMSGVPSWQPENLGQDFGGSLTNATISGAVTLTQETYYNELTLAPGCNINLGGYNLYAKKIIADVAGITGALQGNGNNATNGSGTTAGSGGAALPLGTLGASVAGGNGAAGSANNGIQGVAGGAISNSNGGGGGASGNSGAGGTGLLAAGAAGGGASGFTSLQRFVYEAIRGVLLIQGGAGGRGGNSGGGDGAQISRGAGGGGGGARVCKIYCGELVTSALTPAGVIQANGGNGATNLATPATGNVGGSGGGGGGGGGAVIFMYGKRTGPAVTNFIQANGGNGGNGSPGLGTGIAGNGGSGGNGGSISTFNVSTNVATEVIGAAGSAGTAGSGAATPGVGGAGGLCQITI